MESKTITVYLSKEQASGYMVFSEEFGIPIEYNSGWIISDDDGRRIDVGYVFEYLERGFPLQSPAKVIYSPKKAQKPSDINEIITLYPYDNYVFKQKNELYGDCLLLALGYENGRMRFLSIAENNEIKLINGFEDLGIPSYIKSPKSKRFHETIKLFEELINSKKVKEHELQSFFECHPFFLLEYPYEAVFPHIILRKNETNSLVPDFVLKSNLHRVSCAIVELKLPTAPIITPFGSGYRKFSEAVQRGIAQIQAYHDYFNDPSKREQRKNGEKFYFYKPELFLIIGRIGDTSFEDWTDMRYTVGMPSVEIRTYDEIRDRVIYKYNKVNS